MVPMPAPDDLLGAVAAAADQVAAEIAGDRADCGADCGSGLEFASRPFPGSSRRPWW
jgi:hypothetical protein